MVDNNLKFCRETIEMSQSELGAIFGVHKSTVSGWETGKDIIPLSKLVKFCNLYNFSLDYVCGLDRKNSDTDKLNKIDKKAIGRRLYKLRIENKLTQREIATNCSSAQTTYSNYELGNNLITTMTLYTICKIYNTSMDYIIGKKKK